MFALKRFQRDDLSKLALVDGAILGYQPGLGKTLMGVAWSLLKVGFHADASGFLLPAEPILCVCPDGLISQMCEDYRGLFGKAWPGETRIDSQDRFRALLEANGGRLKPGWYFSSYQQVALNKMQILPIVPDEPLSPGEERAYLKFFKANSLDECRRLARERPQDFSNPPLAELMRDHFACVLIDEATHVKSEDSIIGMGVRRLNPRFRLALSGTPIKNRLPDIYFLAAWACDALEKPNDRFPFANVDEFTEAFSVQSTNETIARRYKNRPGNITPGKRLKTSSDRAGAPSHEICNIPKLHRALAGIVLRRRKCDISDCEIVQKIHHRIVVPFGAEQARVYQHHLGQTVYDRRGQADVIGKIGALRTCAAAPTAESLYGVRSAKPFTPKIHACLEIVRSALARGEQVVIFSPFHAPLDILHGYLYQAGIPHDVLDGRLSASKRAVLAGNFKKGLPEGNPVMLAGIKAMGEGHSFHRCSNCILFTLDYALDLILQAEDRVHRLNSPKPVNIYTIIVERSIEVVLETMLREKANAADIALDGESSPIQTEDMRAEDLLNIAQRDFSKDGLIDEDVCLEKWPRLRHQLSNAWQEQNVGLVAA